jgi:hypothetical protein
MEPGGFLMDAASRTAILASLADELNGAYLYDALARAEKDERLAEVANISDHRTMLALAALRRGERAE